MKVDAILFSFLALAVCTVPLTALKHSGKIMSANSTASGIFMVQGSTSSTSGSSGSAAASSLSSAAQKNITDRLKDALNKNASEQPVDLEYFKILNLSTNKVEKISVKDYVRGVVAAEMPPDFHPEALKAQAIASHSYALRQAEEQRKKPDPALMGADFSADPQNWIGYVTEKQARERFGEKFDIYWSKITQAADSVNRYIITYEQQPILAAYHAISTGSTEASENVWQQSLPYLTPVESEGDLLAPDYETVVKMTAQQVKTALTAKFTDIKLPADCKSWFSDIERSQSGYILSAKVGNITVHGKDIRSALNLRSSNIKIDCDGSSFTFTVCGYGHGVGMSQYGADYMARQGATFEEILLHYYPDTTITQLG